MRMAKIPLDIVGRWTPFLSSNPVRRTALPQPGSSPSLRTQSVDENIRWLWMNYLGQSECLLRRKTWGIILSAIAPR